MTAPTYPLRSLFLLGLLGLLASATVAAEPAVDLKAQAEKIAQTQLKHFGQGYVAQGDAKRHLLYISALDETHLRETVELLAAFTDAWQKTLLAEPLPWNVTVILPTVEDYRKLASARGARGFYRTQDHMLIAIDRGRVLLHEFTHALHHADAAAGGQVHPMWICEGLATLSEACEITPDGLQPQVDTRAVTLQNALRTKTAIPLARLLELDFRAFARNARLAYAQSQYMMLYLHQQGKLKAWYKEYKATYASDRTGKKALEKVLAKPLATIEDDWMKWVNQLRLPLGETKARQGRIGLEFQNCPQGAKVVGLVSGGAAEKAGRIKVGDIITKFNGHTIANTAQLVGAVRAAGANRTVEIRILRHEKPLTIHQPLGAPESE